MNKEFTKVFGVTTDKERAFYKSSFTHFKDCKFSGDEDGESALKECDNLLIENTVFELRYPLWHVTELNLRESQMTSSCRAPLWYGKDVILHKVQCDGVKALRECEDVTLSQSKFNSQEFGWKCSRINAYDLEVNGEYPFFMINYFHAEKVNLTGKYSFQYAFDVYLKNAVLTTKDAFWHSKNVIVQDSEIKGEYLGWYSENLTLIRCKISGTQPLCYCKNLTLIDCEMIGCDLSFENSTVNAKIIGSIDSVKNPIGSIECDKIGEIIIDEFSKGEVKIVEKSKE